MTCYGLGDDANIPPEEAASSASGELGPESKTCGWWQKSSRIDESLQASSTAISCTLACGRAHWRCKMKRYIDELLSLSAAELLIVLFTPASVVAVSAAIFFG